MNNDLDDSLDRLLREQSGGPVPDDGFSLSVMERLPARRRRAIWPLAAGTVAGLATGGISLWSSPMVHAAWQGWISGAPSSATFALVAAMGSMAVLAMAWSIAETADHAAAR